MEVTINGKKIKIDKEFFEFIKIIDAKIYVGSAKNSYPLIVFGYADNKPVSQDLHRFIMGCPSHVTIDHINRDILDCRSRNLRYATRRQQVYNREKSRKGEGYTSIYKGVCWRKCRERWMAVIYHKGKQYNLGYFLKEEDAAIAYNTKARELFGEFAYINDI